MFTSDNERTAIKAGDLIYFSPEKEIGVSRPQKEMLRWSDKQEKRFSFKIRDTEFEEFCQAIADACDLRIRRFRGHPTFMVFEFY